MQAIFSFPAIIWPRSWRTRNTLHEKTTPQPLQPKDRFKIYDLSQVYQTNKPTTPADKRETKIPDNSI